MIRSSGVPLQQSLLQKRAVTVIPHNDQVHQADVQQLPGLLQSLRYLHILGRGRSVVTGMVVHNDDPLSIVQHRGLGRVGRWRGGFCPFSIGPPPNRA